MISFRDSINQKAVIEYFSGALRANRLHHAYLFAGREGTGKCAMALEWARALNCAGGEKKPCYECENCRKIGEMKHPDVNLYSPTPPGTKKEESVYESLLEIRAGIAKDPYRRIVLSPAWVFRTNWIQEIINITSLKKAGRGTRVFILLGVDQMNQEAANRFLKTLEEPPGGVLFILTASDPARVLPTIRSRCIPVQFAPLHADYIGEILTKRYGIGEVEARACARISGGSLSRALDCAEQGMAEKMRLAARIIQAGLYESGEIIPAVAEELGRLNGEFPVRDVLQFLSFCVNSALIRKNALSGEEISSQPEPPTGGDELADTLMQFSEESLRAMAGEIEKSIDLTEKNVYLNLILIVLIQKIRKVLRSGEYSRA